MQFKRQFLRFTAALAVSFLSVQGANAQVAKSPADIPVADFFRVDALQSPALSPDGSRIAMLVPGPKGRRVLAIADAATPTKRVGVAQFDDADVGRVWWVNDKRVLFTAIDYQSGLGDQFGGGLYAVDVDGENFVWLVGRGAADESKGTINTRPLRWTHRLRRTLRDGSDDILVERFNIFSGERDGETSSILRLNTRTKAIRPLIPDEPRHAVGWALDNQLRPVTAMTVERGSDQARVLWRAEPTGPWTEIASFGLFDDSGQAIDPMGVTDNGDLLIRARRNDPARTSALFRFDPRTRKLSPQPLLGLKDFDFDGGQLIQDARSGNLVGAVFTSDALGTVWFDSRMQQIQKRVDELLPGTNNVFGCDQCGEQRRFLVTSFSDRQAPVYFLFDSDKPGKEALRLVGASRPTLDASLMAEQDLVYVTTRDGKRMPVYVTKPRGKGPWPTVVLVHGGPFLRGHSWGWRDEPQFLASRGYLVVEPEFRGSTGYGDVWFRAGLKQWGLAMQDDVTDATRWAISQGMADAKRIALAGASYGGYATMMGLVKEPDLYRAGINWVGVTDIELIYDVSWSDSSDVWKRFGMPRMIGDKDKDRDQLRRTSPLRRASEITKPVLMAYGGQDFRVPLPHGTEMRDALRKAGKVEVEWVEYEAEGHSFLLEANRLDFYSRFERFLARHLK
jgi:dipeptidyl aminopeptidase/acylaminoacyl peptidase